MRLNIEQSPNNTEVEIIIRCGQIDDRLEALIQQIRLYAFSVQGKLEGRSYAIPLHKICYFESVDDKTYLYTSNSVYDCEYRLYELENKLGGTSLCRVSKAVLLNTTKVDSVRPMLGGRLEALLENGEKVLINRHYVAGFKAKFGLEGGLG